MNMVLDGILFIELINNLKNSKVFKYILLE